MLTAQEELPRNWRLVLKAGFRPLSVQTQLLQAFIEQTKRAHPKWTADQRLAHARIFVSDPTIAHPPHVTGGAVDIDVWDATAQEYVDMGCPPNTDSELAYLHSAAVSTQAQQNRRKLLLAMLAAGFAPLANEWWHYQYGEAQWAAFYGHKTTKYDLIKL